MQLLPPAVIFAGQYGELRTLPPKLSWRKEAGKGTVETTDRRSNKGRRGMDGGGKNGIGNPSLQLFSRDCTHALGIVIGLVF